MTTELDDQVLAVDFRARDTARSMGASAVDVLERHVKDRNGNIRDLAIRCLGEIGGPRAAEIFVDSLADEYSVVARRAAGYLMTDNSPLLLSPLLDKYDTVKDPTVRAMIPLIIGKLDNPAAVPELKKRLNQSPPKDAEKSITLALARLREQPWLDDVLQQLKAAEVPVRIQGLKDLEYLGHPDLLKRVTPLLKDKSPAVNVGPPPSVLWVRVCDEAVNVITRVTGHKFSFNATLDLPFTDDQIGEVERFVTGV